MEEEITLDLKEFFVILRKRVKIIATITLIATIITAILSFLVIKPTYEATLSVFIGKTSDSKEDRVSYDNSDIMMYQKLVKTYAKIATSSDIAEKTAVEINKNLTGKDIEDMVKVTPQQDTQILDIKVQNKDPKEAKEIVEKLTTIFIAKAEKVIPNGNIQILDKAKVPKNPVKPNKKLNVAIAFFLGIMVSVGIVFVMEYMDNTLKTQEDVERYLEIPVLGMIPEHAVE